MTRPHDPTLSATWGEIHAQPEIWRAWARRFDPAPLRDWIAGLGVDEVWFCGAGTSAYVGDILAAVPPALHGRVALPILGLYRVGRAKRTRRSSPKRCVANFPQFS